MATAFLSSMRSINPDRQGGACIVNTDNRIVGMGYCGFPRGLDNIPLTGDESDDSQFYICHSIMNAILNENQYDVRGCRIYCTYFPCNECAKMIIQSGINRVTYSVEPEDGINSEASKILFTLAGVSVCRFIASDTGAVSLKGIASDHTYTQPPVISNK